MNVGDLANIFLTETYEVGRVLFQQGDRDGDGFVMQLGRVILPRHSPLRYL